MGTCLDHQGNLCVQLFVLTVGATFSLLFQTASCKSTQGICIHATMRPSFEVTAVETMHRIFFWN